MNKVTAAITGVNGYVPDYILTNKELESMVDTNDEWIVTRTGIKERRILKGENQGTSVMAIEAVNGLLKKTNTDPLDVDLLICATVTPDLVFPATANLICYKTGMTNAFSFDLAAACSGFLYALSVGSRYIMSGTAKKVIVLGADKMSSIINYKDRATCIIFGDGAGAVMLEPNYDGLGLIDDILKTDGSGEPFLKTESGGSRRPASIETVQKKEHYAYQEGAVVFKHAVEKMAEVSLEIMKKNNLTAENIQWLAPHQANKRIIESTANRINLPMEKVLINIHKYGNTTAGTIPLCLWDYEKKIKKGDNVLMAAFGGGFTWGASYLKWAYNS